MGSRGVEDVLNGDVSKWLSGKRRLGTDVSKFVS